MSQKPRVDRLKQELAGRAQVIRIDVRSAGGQELAESLGLEMVPTFITFDKSGAEIWVRRFPRSQDRGPIEA